MKEHLSASVEAGTIEKLQALAGGQRKVGEFLTKIIDLMWKHRDLLKTNKLQDLIIAPPLSHPDLEAIVLNQDKMIAELINEQSLMKRKVDYFQNVWLQAMTPEGYKIDEDRIFRMKSSSDDEQESST